MKKIERIYLLLDEEKIKYMYVIYHNFQIDKFRYTKKINSICYETIKRFEKQTQLSRNELIHQHKIIYHQYSKKLLRKFTDILIDIESYRGYRINNFIYSITSFSFSILEFLTNHWLEIPIVGVNKFCASLSILFLPSLFNNSSQIDIERNYKLTKFPKKFYLKTGSLMFLSLIALTDSYNLPSPSTLPYYYDIQTTDITDSSDFENLSSEELHIKAVNTIFDDLPNNPYLTEDELNSLLELKEYYLENPYLDYDALYRMMMTVTIHNKYSFCDPTIVGSTFQNSRVINVYYNRYSRSFNKNTILHEAIHKTGCFHNPILNEGMTKLLEIEYFNDGMVDGYQKEVIVTKLFCEIIGSDILLEAYTTRNDDMINNALLKIYKQQEVVDSIYNLMKEYVNSNTKEEYVNNYFNLCLFLVNEAPDEIKNAFIVMINNFGKSEKGYFSQEYKGKCLEKQKQKVYK